MAIEIFAVMAQIGSPLYEMGVGGNCFIVAANSPEEAKVLAASYYKGDSNAFLTSSQVQAFLLQSFFDFEAWRLRVIIYDADPVIDVSFTGGPLAELTDIMAGIVTALNADPQIAGANYNGTSHVLTVAETTDGLGDKQMDVLLYPGISEGLTGFVPDWKLDNPQPMPLGPAEYFDNKVDQGLAGAALTVELVGFAHVPGFMNLVTSHVAGQSVF